MIKGISRKSGALVFDIPLYGSKTKFFFACRFVDRDHVRLIVLILVIRIVLIVIIWIKAVEYIRALLGKAERICCYRAYCGCNAGQRRKYSCCGLFLADKAQQCAYKRYSCADKGRYRSDKRYVFTVKKAFRFLALHKLYFTSHIYSAKI